VELIAVLPRHMQALLAARPAADSSGPLWVDGAWAETQVLLPEGSPGNWRCLFTEHRHNTEQNSLPVAALLADFPLGVLGRTAD
jgi:maltooligosyltrehalose synthase